MPHAKEQLLVSYHYILYLSSSYSKHSFTYNRPMNKPLKQKTILHMDGDAFFVGVEIAKNPKLRGLPVVTGEERGIVSALSYEAKALGVVRGMPIFRIKKEFPMVKILPGDYSAYAKYSQMMFDIVRRYADDVEEYSIDECFADLTGLDKPLKMSYRQIAEKIKEEINNEMDLSISVGVAPTKVLAKVASKWIKPNGLTMIEPDTAIDFLKKVSIEKIWGIGPKTTDFLRKRNIRFASDFSTKNIEWIKENLPSPYEAIWYELNGISVMTINADPKVEYSSIQKTRSFYPASSDRVFLFSQLSKHIEDACTKARHFSLSTRKVSIFLKSKDFRYFTYSFVLPIPTSTPETIISFSEKFFNKIYNEKTLYRTTGVTLHSLISDASAQIDLFGERERVNKFELVHKQIDSLENKYGRRVVYLASTHNAIKYRKNNVMGTDSEDLDRDLLFL